MQTLVFWIDFVQWTNSPSCAFMGQRTHAQGYEQTKDCCLMQRLAAVPDFPADILLHKEEDPRSHCDFVRHGCRNTQLLPDSTAVSRSSAFEHRSSGSWGKLE
jgi:hypothetical protein